MHAGCLHDALATCALPAADGPCGSLLHFEQAVSPRGLPPLLSGAVRAFALAQVSWPGLGCACCSARAAAEQTEPWHLVFLR